MPSREFTVSPEAFGPVKSGEFTHPLRITILQGNLLTQKVDAIINPAKESLRGGEGLDGMIHRAALVNGVDKLDEECITLGGCEIGNAKITKGYSLPASHIIHAVGPIYPDKLDDKWGHYNEWLKTPLESRKREIEKERKRDCIEARELLLQVHKNILRVARENKLKTIAIPAISTGIFGYPPEEAAYIAQQAVFEDLRDNGEGTLEEIRFVLFEIEKYELYEKAFS